MLQFLNGTNVMVIIQIIAYLMLHSMRIGFRGMVSGPTSEIKGLGPTYMIIFITDPENDNLKKNIILYVTLDMTGSVCYVNSLFL